MAVNRYFSVLIVFFLIFISCEKNKKEMIPSGETVKEKTVKEEILEEVLIDEPLAFANDSKSSEEILKIYDSLIFSNNSSSSSLYPEYSFTWKYNYEYDDSSPYEGETKEIRETSLVINGQSFIYYSKERTIYLDTDEDDSIYIRNYILQDPVWEAVTLQGIMTKNKLRFSSDTIENFPTGYSITGIVNNIFKNRYPENDIQMTEYVFVHKDDPSKLLWWHGDNTAIFLDRTNTNNDYFNEIAENIHAQQTREEIMLSNRSGVIYSVAFSPDGRQILSSSVNGAIYLWDAASGNKIRSFIGQIGSIRSVSFSPDGANIISGSESGTIKLWDTASGNYIKTFTLFETGANGIRSVVFSPDGSKILCGSRDIRLLDISTGRVIRTINSAGFSASFSPDGRYIISSDETSSEKYTKRLWDTETGRLIRTFPGQGDNLANTSLAVSPDGKHIAFPFNDDIVKICDIETGMEIKTFSGNSGTVRAVALSPDGKYIAAALGGYVSIIKLWDINTGREIRTYSGHSDIVETLAFSHDGKYIASGSYDNTIRIWDTAANQAVKILGTERRPSGNQH